MGSTPHALNSWESGSRASAHARDPELEAALKLLNERIALGKEQVDERPTSPAWPVIFIVGCARSGSTLLLQWLAATEQLCYPTNIMSRFYRDPGLGALVHRVLHDLDRRGEIFPERATSERFRSELGRSKGADAPHDFGYFWRAHFAFGEHQGVLTHHPDEHERHELVADLAAVQQVFGKPLAMKAMQMNWHIPLLKELFPNSVFLFSRRAILENAWSLMRAREDYFGDASKWYSFKPPQFARILELEPWEQCVAQVYHTEQAVQAGLSAIPAPDTIVVDHEEFCDAPGKLYAALAERIELAGPYTGPALFTRRERAMPQELVERGQHFLDQLQRGSQAQGG